MLIYGRNSSGRKKPSKKTLKLRQERKDFFAAILANKTRQRPNNMPDLSCESKAAPLSNSIPGYGFKKSVDDWKWKRDREETAETIKEIERKKTRVAPAYNKGATQYITDGADPTTLGRKV
jgi:hypothetical protein